MSWRPRLSVVRSMLADLRDSFEAATTPASYGACHRANDLRSYRKLFRRRGFHREKRLMVMPPKFSGGRRRWVA
jgi:hypothetical protein